MIYELLLTLLILVLGCMVYMQYLKIGKIYLFQEAVHIRISARYFEQEMCEETGRTIVKLRLELLVLAPFYKGVCIDEIVFLKNKNIRHCNFNRFFFSAASKGQRARELSLYIDRTQLPEIRLNGLELYISGYLLCAAHNKHPISQKFIVFERPAILDLIEEQEQNRA